MPQDKMLFCDSCDRGYHTFCVGLAALPKGDTTFYDPLGPNVVAQLAQAANLRARSRRVPWRGLCLGVACHLPSPTNRTQAPAVRFERGKHSTVAAHDDSLWGLLRCRSLGLQALWCLRVVWDDNTRPA